MLVISYRILTSPRSGAGAVHLMHSVARFVGKAESSVALCPLSIAYQEISDAITWAPHNMYIILYNIKGKENIGKFLFLTNKRLQAEENMKISRRLLVSKNIFMFQV